ncbi:MAG: glycosyltransferase family 4 protein [Vampirovibrio sp.]|nr:glycosyltransferase family 4 protein [Vampirovibrio sp.]
MTLEQTISKTSPQVLIIGSDPTEQGGIGTVLSIYHQQGFMENKRFLITHREGTAVSRVFLFAKALCQFLWLLFTVPTLQVIHAHVSERGSFFRKSILVWLAKAAGKKNILHNHGAEFLLFYDHCPFPVQWFIRKTLLSCDAVIVLSQQWATDIRAIVPQANIQVVYNPVVIPEAIKNSQTPSKSDDPVSFLFLGRVGKRKGAFDIVEAMSQLPDLPAKVHFYGDGALEEINHMIQAKGLTSKIEVHGWIRGEQKQGVINAADIMLLPSYNEGLPLTVLEALANGMPVLSTPVGGIPEAVENGVNGYLVPPGDTTALAQQISTLTTEVQQRQTMGQKSLRRAQEKFDHRLIFNQLEALYQNLIG